MGQLGKLRPIGNIGNRPVRGNTWVLASARAADLSGWNPARRCLLVLVRFPPTLKRVTNPLVPVGMVVTHHPPDRTSARATNAHGSHLGFWRQSEHRDRGEGFRQRVDVDRGAPESGPSSNGSVDCVAAAPTASGRAHVSEKPRGVARCQVQRDIGNTREPLRSAIPSRTPSSHASACAASAQSR